ncbi:ABC transporter ATP-binding protein [Magnetofaba australis]|uniref:Putative ABC transporter n=1 Tax=Magnetofaba australis IT-1 TaxID=1434232 RepID=A0A1Y2K8W2_9PROT|nr:ABC transporter ATP-binding protein [Magnetofaba australis]OSM05116.1 putative ABC transporter [Magnetofaba australis IT-1]
MAEPTQSPLIEIEDLNIAFETPERRVEAVRGASLAMAPGEILALVGESGSGKSVTALSLLNLLPGSARIHARRRQFAGRDLTGLDEHGFQQLRGRDIAVVFQEPMTALNPVQRIGAQVMEPLRIHHKSTHEAMRERALALLAQTGLPDPQRAFNSYPHQLSGGQRQRVMIAAALACGPQLLIADEPTTALDVTIQAQILTLLKQLRSELGMGMLLITHDLPMVRHTADRVCVMRHGQIVETGSVVEIFENPQHPYTQQLLASLPSDRAPQSAQPRPEALYEAQALKCYFPIKRGLFKRTVDHVRAVDDVSITLRRGETVGVVGESGSGKSTLGETLLRLNAGHGSLLKFDGTELGGASRKTLRSWRRHAQVVFQDPFSSLSPRMTIEQIMSEGLEIHAPDLTPAQRRARSVESLVEAGLDESALERYPHQFSGGQRQRIAIARAMALRPQFLILDEPTSALDLSVQAQILDLLRKLQREHGLTYLFISHDLRVVRALSHEVLVMQNGRVVEQGPTETLFNNPQHPYTRQLLAAALKMSASEQSPSADA